MSRPVPIRRALISVSDKTGLIDFARKLDARGIEILSTGGSAKSLREAGLTVVDVADVTGFPEMMDGRVKTLHPAVHGGLLALRDNAEHLAAMEAHGIGPIDLLVVNLYPFEETAAKGAGYDDCIENIDIGGPAMIRAAAKNHGFVTVIVDVQDYDALLAELDANDDRTTLAFRQRQAQIAYARTAAYDAAVSAPCPNPCAMARIRIRGRPSMSPARTARALPRRVSGRARNCPTTTSTTPTRHSSWWRSSTRRKALPARSSSTPIPAASRGATARSMPISGPSIATGPRPLAASSR